MVIQHDSRAVIAYLMFNKDNVNSILNIVTFPRENVRSVQEQILKDLWKCENKYYHEIKYEKLFWYIQHDDPTADLDILIRQIMVYHGTAHSAMEGGGSRSFMRIGKNLVRSIQSIDFLNNKYSSVVDNEDLSRHAALLEAFATF